MCVCVCLYGLTVRLVMCALEITISILEDNFSVYKVNLHKSILFKTLHVVGVLYIKEPFICFHREIMYAVILMLQQGGGLSMQLKWYKKFHWCMKVQQLISNSYISKSYNKCPNNKSNYATEDVDNAKTVNICVIFKSKTAWKSNFYIFFIHSINTQENKIY